MSSLPTINLKIEHAVIYRVLFAKMVGMAIREME